MHFPETEPGRELIWPVCLTRSAPEGLAGRDKGWGRELVLFIVGRRKGFKSLSCCRQRRSLWSCRPKDSGFREGGHWNPDGEDGLRKIWLMGESCNFRSRIGESF